MIEKRKHPLNFGEFIEILETLIRESEETKPIEDSLPVTVSRIGGKDYNVTGIAVFEDKIRITTNINPIGEENAPTNKAKEAK